RGVMPRLVAGIAARVAALQVDRECQQSVAAPLRHGGDELVGVPLAVPALRIRIRPLAARLGVEVVEDALHQTRVEQQALDLLLLPGAAGVGRAAVQQKYVAADRDLRLSRCENLLPSS